MNKETSDKENPADHIQTPTSFSKDASSKMLSEDDESVQVKFALTSSN